MTGRTRQVRTGEHSRNEIVHGPAKGDKKMTVGIESHWWPVKEPQVGVRFEFNSGHGISVFMSGDEARAFGMRMIEEGDKMLLQDRKFGTYNPGRNRAAGGRIGVHLDGE